MSRRSHWALLALCAGAFAFTAYAMWSFRADEPGVSPAGEDSRASLTVSIAGGRVLAEVANTPEQRAQGLSGRSSLPQGSGMLFVFPEDGLWSFWMKDMRFSIDIIWISREKRVVHVRSGVSPDTFPQSFAPPAPARYVLEVPAGWAAAHGVSVGDSVNF